MLQHSLPDQAKVYEAILKWINMATSGRHVPDTRRPAGSFVHKSDASISETLTATLQKDSGKINIYENRKNTYLRGIWAKSVFCIDC